MPRQSPLQREDKEQHLLDAAYKLFWEKAFSKRLLMKLCVKPMSPKEPFICIFITKRSYFRNWWKKSPPAFSVMPINTLSSIFPPILPRTSSPWWITLWSISSTINCSFSFWNGIFPGRLCNRRSHNRPIPYGAALRRIYPKFPWPSAIPKMNFSS